MTDKSERFLYSDCRKQVRGQNLIIVHMSVSVFSINILCELFITSGELLHCTTTLVLLCGLYKVKHSEYVKSLTMYHPLGGLQSKKLDFWNSFISEPDYYLQARCHYTP